VGEMRTVRRKECGGAAARQDDSNAWTVGMLAVAVQLDLGRLLAVVAAVLRSRRDLALATGVRAFVLLSGFSHRSPPWRDYAPGCVRLSNDSTRRSSATPTDEVKSAVRTFPDAGGNVGARIRDCVEWARTVTVSGPQSPVLGLRHGGSPSVPFPTCRLRS
jgi:hypothetical protein